MNDIAADRVVLHFFDQRDSVGESRRRRLQANQMRAFESCHTVGEILLIQFERNRRRFRSVKNRRNLPTTEQTFGVPFALLNALINLYFKSFQENYLLWLDE